MEEENVQLASSPNSKRTNKKPSLSLVGCFKGTKSHRRRSSFDVSSSSSPAFLPPSPRKSPSWINPEIKGKYKNFMSKMNRHRRHSSADFSYDPLSYSLNFDENDFITHEPEDPYRSFTSRLPSSPPKSAPWPASVSGINKSLSEMSVSSPRTPPPPPPQRRNVNGVDVLNTSGRRIRDDEVIEVLKRASIDKSTTPRAAAIAEVKRSLENVTPSVVAQTALVSSSG